MPTPLRTPGPSAQSKSDGDRWVQVKFFSQQQHGSANIYFKLYQVPKQLVSQQMTDGHEIIAVTSINQN